MYVKENLGKTLKEVNLNMQYKIYVKLSTRDPGRKRFMLICQVITHFGIMLFVPFPILLSPFSQ